MGKATFHTPPTSLQVALHRPSGGRSQLRSAFLATVRCWLEARSPSESAITSSWRECKMIVFALTVVAVPHFFQAGHKRISGVFLESMFIATAPLREEPTTYIGRVLIEFCLSDADGSKIIIGESGVDDLVAVACEVGWLFAARR